MLLLTATVFIQVAGCGSSAINDPVALDKQIEKDWMPDREMVDAISFLEGGGKYEDFDEASTIDQTCVLPLLKRFRDELSLSPRALLEDPQLAMAILVEVPEDASRRTRLRKMLQEADESFSGLLMDNWGQKWLSLDFLDDNEVAALKKAQIFEKIQGELEYQRRLTN
jgi:hypothetical protein